MKTDYANKTFLKSMQRENKLESLGRTLSQAVPYIAGTLAGIGLVYGLTCLSSETTKPYTDKAAYQIEQKADYEQMLDNFIYRSGAQRR